MSISSTTARNNYTGNGAVSVFAYGFKIFDQGDLVVKVVNLSGTTTTLTLTTDYTVSGVGGTSGGNVTLVNASQAWLTAGKLTTGYTLAIYRLVDLIQSTDIRNQGSFFPETHEDAFDYLTMIDQQQQDQLDRSIHLPATIDPADFDASLPADIASSAGSAILVNGTGDGFVMGDQVSSISFGAGFPLVNPSATALALRVRTDLSNTIYIWVVDEWRAIA